MAAGAKVSFTVGGRGTKPDVDYKYTSTKRFTKAERRVKPILGNQTRINKTSTDNRLRTMTDEEIALRDKAFKDAALAVSPWGI